MSIILLRTGDLPMMSGKFYFERDFIKVQFLFQLFPIIISGMIMFLLLLCAARIPSSSYRIGSAWDISWMLPETPARDEFNLFVLQAVMISAILICSLIQVSNHIILSMDILYILSLAMLFLYHTLKVADLRSLTAIIASAAKS